MRKVILEVKGVRGIDLLQTRLFGSKMYVDIEISAEGDISLNEAHDIAENVHHTIEDNFKDVKHCMVHVNPVNEKNIRKNKIPAGLFPLIREEDPAGIF